MSASEAAVYQRQGFGATLGIVGKVALLIVDFVNGFADPASFGGGNIGPAIANTTRALAEARKRGWPIAHTRIVFADDGSDGNIFSLKVPTLLGLTEASRLSAIVDELTPLPGECVIRKRTPSAFFGTDLAPWLAKQGIQTVLVAGTTTSGCVRASVVDAMAHGFRPIVMTDCVGDRAIGPHDANLFDMGQKNADLMTLDEVLAVVG